MEPKNFKYTPDLYDLQVNWPKRLEKEKVFFTKIFSSRKIKNLLDIGCGTGHHVQFFSSYAEKITAIDPSEEMLAYAKENIIKAKNIELFNGGFEDIGRLPAAKYDIITCLGNTISLLENRRNIKLALKSVKNILANNGLVIFQFLNFEPEVIEKNRYYQPKVAIKDGKKYIFMKHFEFGKVKTRADFMIIILDGQDKMENFYVNSSNFCTLRKKLFVKMSENSGFKKVELLNPEGNGTFNSKEHISLFALMNK
ncbi:MAG: methyltransferase domain-containing protein [Actinobacteria bacterium]|nr:methyltransferase domain-containing protein [Actinomycetota bacterium]